MEHIPFLRFHGSDTQTMVAVSLLMLVAGLLALFYGWKLYKVLLVITFGLMAGYLGWYFLRSRLPEHIAFLAPLFAGLLGALAAIPIQRAVVFLLGAAVGFISIGPVGAELIWTQSGGPSPTQYLIAGVIAAILLGVLALILFRPAMIIATSLFGATLVLSAGVHLFEAVSSSRASLFNRYPVALAWVYAGIAIVGVLFQTVVSKKRSESV